mgnify:CR=1 FL=1
MSAADLEVRVPLGGTSDPVLVMGRPELMPRHGRTAPWIVESAAGSWIAIGRAEIRARGSVRTITEPNVPPAAHNALQLAISRAATRWGEIMADERTTSEYVDGRRAAIVGCQAQITALRAEIVKIENQIAQALGSAADEVQI